MSSTVAPGNVSAVRRFSRFYTRAIGVLHEGLLGSDLTLAEARIVYELASLSKPTATLLGQELGLDAGYLSRLLKSLEGRGVLTRSADPADGRQSLLTLTAAGRKLFFQIDNASKREVAALLSPLAAIERQQLVTAMGDIARLLGAPDWPSPPIVLRPHRPGDIGHVVSRHGAIYAAEYGWDITFEALVAKVAAEFIEKFDPRSDCCFIADRAGQILGSAFVVRKDAVTAKLRLVYVEKSARGTGLGRRLVEACMQFSRAAGYSRMTLWTNDVLLPARKLYQALGFEMVASEPYHSFGVDLVSETWERDL